MAIFIEPTETNRISLKKNHLYRITPEQNMGLETSLAFGQKVGDLLAMQILPKVTFNP